jgi:hypothetical protein
MTQGNLLPEDDDRSRPRYQPPTVGSFPPTNRQGGGNPSRPADWPAPDPATDPTFSPYGPPAPPPADIYGPAVPPPSTWGGQPPVGPRPDNFYRYENYSQTPYQPGPPPPIDPQAEAYRQATRRVKAKLDFRRHLQSYLVVNAFLWAIALITMNPGRPSFWPIWITVFWGIGLFAQYWQISGREDEQRRRMIDEEMRRKHRY